VTIAAGLAMGVVTPDTLIDTNPGWMPNGRYRTTDTSNHGVLTVTGVITKSSNVGAAKVVNMLPDRAYYDFVRRFGYGTAPGSGFPGESAGVLPPVDAWSGTTKQTMGYGYGLSATPLQIAEVYAAFANGGRMIAPTFVKGQRNEPHEVLDPKIAHEVMKMMQTVTEPGGTATTAAILGYHVAGKTGTARMASGGGYAARKYISTFAGVVPVDNPRFAMAVVVSEPDPSRRGYYGGSVSGPVFHDVMQGALRLMDVPPDDIGAWVAAQEKQKSKARVAVAATPAPVATAPLTSTNPAAPAGAAQ
jgi:cell division protein FtsI (penicillin-binding protein 3)